ncbi:hypothetical protein EUTSA_v10015773mg [Eutrema salsugineum]|uniref:uridine/cytidine kinase n=1 Tax=Eutrema salsugineum TaxID=72664 RepID=V4LK64_EUTSA|nr:hypothetical protein EUTSA_v10015773mg [Eutrema salsugineum]
MIEASSKVHYSGFHMNGVTGGAASGKTSICDMMIQQLHDQRVVLVNQDSFYHSLTEEELARVHEYNFDHRDAFDIDHLLSCMEKLRQGQAVDIPKYDFKTYKSTVSRRVNPSDVILLEGILLFHDPRVRGLMNMKIFVDTEDDVRVARRIKRDTSQNDRDIGTVLDQLWTKMSASEVSLFLYFVWYNNMNSYSPVVCVFGSVYSGVDFCKRLCGVSVIRSYFSMENALRACCKGIKIGKILIHREGDKQLCLSQFSRSVRLYEKLPNDIAERHVLLLDPILGTGNSAVQAINLLNYKQSLRISAWLLTYLFYSLAPQGVHVVCKKFPRLKIVTSEIENGLNEEFRVIPGMGEFGDRYFGTDDD